MCSFLASCGEIWNDPYPHLDDNDVTFYTAFSQRPKHLDLAKSYSSNEWAITNQIYEPPLQYNYLARPFKLEPLALESMPKVTYYDQQGNQLPSDTPIDSIASSRYTLKLRSDLQYHPHPAFAKNAQGEYLYHQLTDDNTQDIEKLSDFKRMGTRQCVAKDFVLQIKRLGHPIVQSPVYGLLSEHIVGLKELYESLQSNPSQALNKLTFEGAKAIDDATIEINLKGHYPQFIYWLAMPFFAPIPEEALAFYDQDILRDKNITLDWYPVGTGPYRLVENNPNLQMIMLKNPYWHGEQPTTQSLAKIDKIQFMLEKESIPYWNKFMQGYFDQSGISSDSFDQALQAAGESATLSLTPALKAKDIQLKTSTLPSTYYWGFNMLDKTLGGTSERAKWLRQAISIIFDMEEYINIFLNGRGMVATNPLPPGIFGFSEKRINPITHNNLGEPKRKSIADAKALLNKAGYPSGIDITTNKPLVLYLDAAVSGGPDAAARFAWMRKQFDKLGINLVVRATQYNRFQDKMHNGDAQIFSWGWNADYPDPENFFFLLYGPNGMVNYGGENAANYNNPVFDRLFEKMRVLPNSSEREQIVNQMIELVQQDAPWLFGLHPTLYSLSHGWVKNHTPHPMARNTIKYLNIDTKTRAKKQSVWNQPYVTPLWYLLGGLILLCIPAVIGYWRRTHQKNKKWSMECSE